MWNSNKKLWYTDTNKEKYLISRVLTVNQSEMILIYKFQTDFEITMITVLKDLIDKVHRIHKSVEKLSTDMGLIKKESNGN